ncbi:MAG: hypothetical protein Q8R25_04335 [bacterium]|nr:hypothetical protein [bacterium]
MSNREFCAGGVHYIPVPLDAQEGNYEMEQELDENDSSDEVVPLDEIFHR